MTDSKLCMQKSSNHGAAVCLTLQDLYSENLPHHSVCWNAEIKVTMQREVASFQWNPIPAVCHFFLGAFRKLPAQKQQ